MLIILVVLQREFKQVKLLNNKIMKRLSKTSENLKKVSGSICAINFSSGKFILSDISDSCAYLVSAGRDGVGSSVLSMIPSNWVFRVYFENKYLHLRIFI